MAIKAVVFDVFGTLLEIKDKRRPYSLIYEYLADKENFSVEKHVFKEQMLTYNVPLEDVGQWYGVEIPRSLMHIFKEELKIELSSIRMFPEVEHVMYQLNKKGIHVGVCSNLAASYGWSVLQQLGQFIPLPNFSFSYKECLMKPDSRIYERVCQRMSLQADDILFVGDTYDADFIGPSSYGMKGILLDRKGHYAKDTWPRSTSSLINNLYGVLEKLE